MMWCFTSVICNGLGFLNSFVRHRRMITNMIGGWICSSYSFPLPGKVRKIAVRPFVSTFHLPYEGGFILYSLRPSVLRRCTSTLEGEEERWSGPGSRDRKAAVQYVIGRTVMWKCVSFLYNLLSVLNTNVQMPYSVHTHTRWKRGISMPRKWSPTYILKCKDVGVLPSRDH